jgi:hypothetical protein
MASGQIHRKNGLEKLETLINDHDLRKRMGKEGTKESY